MKRKITILPLNKTIFVEQGETLLNALAQNGYILSAPCGGQGVCGKCKVQIISNGEQIENGVLQTVCACKTRIETDMAVFLSKQEGKGLDLFQQIAIEGEQDGWGIALDIGTTTLAACLVDLRSGQTLEKISCLNPQAVFGADVLSRIKACQDGKLPLLQKAILNKTESIIKELSMGRPIQELVVSANTTMLHLFLGVNPESIGVAPFSPVFTETQYCFGKQLGLSATKVRLLPSVSGYIGSDITAGLIACSIDETASSVLFIDIGTNGEIVLNHQGKLYGASTAAGPALEGACIECGLGGVEGAIDKVYMSNDELLFTTIGNVEAKGICGSGLIDLISILLKEDLIDENGTWNDESDSRLFNKLKDEKLYLTDSVYISQKDIRQFQLAKAAIMAGIETILYESKVEIGNIETLYIAGGLGYYLNVENAVNVGLLPMSLLSKIKLVGNTSLQGAIMCMVKQEYQEKIENVSRRAKIIELSCSKYFRDAYIDNISFMGE